jgi:very-short-patch-repair endonuclease
MAGEKKIRTARTLRQRETELELRLWQELRERRLAGLKFRRQHPVGPYVADFACPEAKLIVEIDGYWHQFRRARDDERTDRLRAFGYDVVRFETSDADGDVGLLVEGILFVCGSEADCAYEFAIDLYCGPAHRPSLTPGPSPFQKLEGRGVQVD